MLMDYMREIKEISAEQAIILWQASRLSLSKIYEKAPEILKVQGSVIGTLGNFSASIGKAKSKKTFNVSAIVAASLKNGTVLRYVAELPENKRKVLYVDTEQSHYHCLKVMKRILRLAGLPDDRDNEHLEFLALRKYTPEQRIRIVEQAIILWQASRLSLSKIYPSDIGQNPKKPRLKTNYSYFCWGQSVFTDICLHI